MRMESGKMTLMNLFAGQQWRRRHREETVDTGRSGGREGGREISWESSMETYTLLYIKQPMGIFCVTQGGQPRALWQHRGGGTGRWTEGRFRRVHIYTYGWFTLIYGRNQYNIVNYAPVKKKPKNKTPVPKESNPPCPISPSLSGVQSAL